MLTRSDLKTRDTGNDENIDENFSSESIVEVTPQSTDLAQCSLDSLVPALRVEQNALVLHKQQQELWSHIRVSYCSAIDEIRSMSAAIELPSSETRALARAFVQARTTGLSIHADALEEARKKLGLLELRDQLRAKLSELISPQRGLEMLSNNIQQIEPEFSPITSIAEANALFPDLTWGELAIFSLLKQIPEAYFINGSKLDPQKVIRKYDPQKYEDAHRRVPQQAWSNSHGIAFITDKYENKWTDHAIYSADPFQILGITGISDEYEFSPFRSDVAKIMQAMIVLSISNTRLFQQVWQSASEAIQIGLAKIERQALQTIIAEEVKDMAAFDDRLHCLSATDKKRYHEVARAFKLGLIRSQIFDLSSERSFTELDSFRLVGLLSRVPQCLVSGTPFIGYIKVNGVTVCFLDENFQIIEQIELSPIFCQNAALGIVDEMNDAGQTNPTVLSIMDQINREIQSKLLDDFAGDLAPPSALEAVALDSWLNNCVRVKILPRYSLKGIETFADMLAYCITPNPTQLVSTRKMTTPEVRLIASTLKVIPRRMLARVKTVIKSMSDQSLSELRFSTVTLGQYRPDLSEIELRETSETLFPDLPAELCVEKAFTLVHECGEALWTELSNDEKVAWAGISWPKKRGQKKSLHFLTYYSYACNPKEDFCEHFAMYVIHGVEFKQRALHSNALSKKYEFFQALFWRYNNAPLQYLDANPCSISDVHGVLEKKIKKIELEKAVLLQEKAAEERAKENADSIKEKVQSVDDIVKEDDSDEEEESEPECDEHEETDSPEEEEADDEPSESYHTSLKSVVYDLLCGYLDEDDPDFGQVRGELVDAARDRDYDAVEDILWMLDRDSLQEIISELQDFC